MKQLKPCIVCNSKPFYSEGFDAYFCHKCDIWLEERCGDKYCYFCSIRPEKPTEAGSIELTEHSQELGLYD